MNLKACIHTDHWQGSALCPWKAYLVSLLSLQNFRSLLGDGFVTLQQFSELRIRYLLHPLGGPGELQVGQGGRGALLPQAQAGGAAGGGADRAGE